MGISMSALVSTPTQDSLQRRFSDFATLGEALDYAALGQRGLNFHDMRGQLARPYPYSELREDALMQFNTFEGYGLPFKEKLELAYDATYFATLRNGILGFTHLTVRDLLEHLESQCLALTNHESN